MKKIKLELIFPGGLKDEPIICELCKNFQITLSIVEASFSTDTGWAILIIESDEAELKKALDYIKAKRVEVKDVQEVK